MRVRSAKQLIIVLRERTQQSKEQRGSSVSRDLSRLCDLSGRVRAKPRKRDFRPWRPLPTNSPPDCLVPALATLCADKLLTQFSPYFKPRLPYKTKRANQLVCSFCWCGKRDLNPYIKDTRPSNVRVCRFRHSRVERYLLYTKEFQKSRGFAKKYFIFFKIVFFDKKLPLSPPDLSKIVFICHSQFALTFSSFNGKISLRYFCTECNITPRVILCRFTYINVKRFYL